MDWLWQEGASEIQLSTEPDTRAERFYRRQGWQEDGTNSKGELRFVLRRHE